MSYYSINKMLFVFNDASRVVFQSRIPDLPYQNLLAAGLYSKPAAARR